MRPGLACRWAGFMMPTPVSPAGLLGMGTSHPLTPSRKARELKAHPFLYGRGMLFYTLIPKGVAAPRWGASRTDGRGNVDRRRTVPTGHLRPIGGGETWLSLWESWHDEVVTERAVFQGGYQRGERQLPPLELNYITFSPSRTEKDEIIAFVPLREGARGGRQKTSPWHATGAYSVFPFSRGDRCL